MMSYYRFYNVMLCDVYEKQKNIRVTQGTLKQCSLSSYICQPPPHPLNKKPEPLLHWQWISQFKKRA